MCRTSGAAFAVAVAAAVLLAPSCASTKLTDWTGHRIDEVIQEFGPPKTVTPMSNGAKMYVWEYQRTFANPSWGPTGSTMQNERRCTATRTFLVRPDGIVASWNMQDCVR
jgi:hypothetical protein